MLPTKRALLIASQYGELLGPNTDVEIMADVLQKRGFCLTRCCGLEATRDGIRASWDQLMLETSPDDVIVIYYSGHGGEVTSRKEQDLQESQQPWRYQFIVPTDYDEKSRDFRGISDVELAHMLLKITKKTHNVTVILDCCHSGRMVRNPYHGKKAVRKSLRGTLHHDLTRHIEQLRHEGRLEGDTFVEGNPYAVRIAAAASWESAYEYENEFGESVGVLTESLVRVITEVATEDVSWRNILLRVRELVNVNFPQQHPQAEGPYARCLFSLQTRDFSALGIRHEDDKTARIQAGRVAGVRERSVYAVMPHGFEHVDIDHQVAEATISRVDGFTGLAEITWKNEASQIPEGSLAFLQSETLHKWAAAVPDDLAAIQNRLEKSKFLRCADVGDKLTLVAFQQEGNKITLQNNRGVQFSSHRFYGTPSEKIIETAVHDAEAVARAHHLLAVSSEVPEEQLRHDMEIVIGLVESHIRGRILNLSGEDTVNEDARIFIHLLNHDPYKRVFVSVFDIEVNGEISLVSKSSVEGIDLPPGRDYTIGMANGKLEGLPVTWPQGVSKAQAVVETLLFVVSSAPVDLRYLQSSRSSYDTGRKSSSEYSSLENRLYSLAQGIGRRVGPEDEGSSIRYDIVQIPILLEPLHE